MPRAMSSEQNERDWIQVVGSLLVILGLGVWGIYIVERYFLHLNVTDRDFLPYHLAGVIPGMLLWQHRLLKSLVKKWFRHGGK